MLKLSLNIGLPWTPEFKNFWCRAWKTPFTNKFIELEFHTIENLVGFNFLWTRKRDHAGIDIQFSLLGVCMHFNFYDCRHWDYEKNCWVDYSGVE